MIREIEIANKEYIDTPLNLVEQVDFLGTAVDAMQLHIAQRIISDPKNTFYFEVDDDQMRYFGILKGSLIIVDRSIPVKSGSIIACSVDDEWLIRKLCHRGSQTLLCLNNNFDACVNITGRDIKILGPVTWTCLPQI